MGSHSAALGFDRQLSRGAGEPLSRQASRRSGGAGEGGCRGGGHLRLRAKSAALALPAHRFAADTDELISGARQRAARERAGRASGSAAHVGARWGAGLAMRQCSESCVVGRPGRVELLCGPGQWPLGLTPLRLAPAPLRAGSPLRRWGVQLSLAPLSPAAASPQRPAPAQLLHPPCALPRHTARSSDLVTPSAAHRCSHTGHTAGQAGRGS